MLRLDNKSTKPIHSKMALFVGKVRNVDDPKIV
jgi:hypothetical protein